MFQPEEDITLDQIDYEWIEKTTNIKSLRRALQVLKLDGGHYPDLERAIEKKVTEVNPLASKNVINNQNIDPEVRKLEEEGLYEWANAIKEKELARQRAAEARGTGGDIFQTSVPESSNVVNFSDFTEDERKRLSENEKNKGNEAVRSGDYKEALQYYTKSIQFYNKLAATYCNRALCYLKLKDYKTCISDCNRTLEIDSKYTKAFHRRAKANFEMGNYGDAVVDFQRVMDLDPNNAEVNAELMEARNKFNKGKSTKSTNLTKPSEFKKITIQEESEESDEEEEQSKAAEGTNNTFDRVVDDMLLEEGKSTLENKLKSIEDLKTKANDLLKTGLYEKAIIEYQKGLNILNNIKLSNVASDTETDLSNRKAVLFNNIGYCYMQMDHPDTVVNYTSKVFELENVNTDTLVKAYLRRALAYEKMDKIAKALQDFESVKHLNPSNMTASEGLHRLHKIINNDEDLKRSIEKSRSQELPKVHKNNKENAPPKKTVSETPQTSTNGATGKVDTVDAEATFTECEALKTKGNDFFKEKNFASAIKTFYEAQAKIEETLKQTITSHARSKLEKLYVQILSNTAMCCFNLNEIEKTLENCEKALILEPTHAKCLYRKALCKQKIGDTYNSDTKLAEIERKKKQLELYQEAKKILEQVLQVDKANKDVRGKLEDVIRTIERIKIDHKQLNEKKAPVKKEEPKFSDEEPKQTSTDNTPRKAKNPTPGIDKEFFENITKNAAKAVTENLISAEELPETSSRFETNCQGFKKNIDKLYFYVKKIPGDYLAGLYKQKGFPLDHFLNMVESIKTSGLNDDAEICAKFFQTITRTFKFDLLVKQLIKGDRKNIKAIFDQIQKSHPAEVEALYDKYNCKDI